MNKNSFLSVAGLVFTILGLMGILSNLTRPVASYIVLGLGLALLIAGYWSRSREK